jgi:phytanoyl-CoA hydroxylase
MENWMLKSDYALKAEQIESYRRDGFVQLNDVITGAALERLRSVVEHAVDAEKPQAGSGPKGAYEQIFIQKVNLWQRHPAAREFVHSKRFGNIAAQLAGMPVRLWHDQALFKEPRTGAKTPWHQDTHYWPHQQKQHQLSIWIALRDATIQNGCLSFLPATHTLDTIEPVDLAQPQDLFSIAPKLKGTKPVTCELKAGSCTFHNGLTFHYAGPNKTDTMREALAILYMPDGTTFSGGHHMCTDNGGHVAGEPLAGENFPLVSDVVCAESRAR